MRFILAAALAALSASPCAAYGEGDNYNAEPGLQAPSGLVLFYESTGPMSFSAMTARDVPAGVRKLREVKGRACQRGLSIPIAANLNATNISAYYGNGGYAKALAEIKKKNPDVIGIYDVRTDVEQFSIMGFYTSLCTEVTARAFALAAAPAVPAMRR